MVPWFESQPVTLLLRLCMCPLLSPPSRLLTPVATMLTLAERSRVDAAGEGFYRTLHRDSIDDVIGDLRAQRVSAVLVSVARCGGEEDVSGFGRIVREFPRIPAVALLTQFEVGTPRAVLSLGQSGVRALVDVRQPNGWRELREVLMHDRTRDIEKIALAQLSLDLAGAPDDCWKFFETIFHPALRSCTIRTLSAELRVVPSTLMSRFFRAHLPAPKRYLAMARLTHAARVFENPGLSVANVANHLEYSSPQSFGRHVRTLLSITALDFRQRYDGEGMLHRFREELILPFVGTLRSFSPLTEGLRWLAGTSSHHRLNSLRSNQR
jgi:AraC-like DNA-binding protein